MQTTNKLGLKITTPLTFDTDDIKDTITSYGNNFEVLEEEVTDSIGDITNLTSGRLYKYGKRMWDNTPLLGGFIGWVNVREGVYAPEWRKNTAYLVGDYMRATPDNGNVYQAVVNGKSMMKTPTFLTNPNVEFSDATGNQWMSTYNYDVDDVAFPTDGSTTHYLVCETAGLSDTSEPNWTTIPVGATATDGSVVWRREKTVKWKQVAASCNFRPFGKIE